VNGDTPLLKEYICCIRVVDIGALLLDTGFEFHGGGIRFKKNINNIILQTTNAPTKLILLSMLTIVKTNTPLLLHNIDFRHA